MPLFAFLHKGDVAGIIWDIDARVETIPAVDPLIDLPPLGIESFYLLCRNNVPLQVFVFRVEYIKGAPLLLIVQVFDDMFQCCAI